jgi:hypothetical protein
VRSWLANPALSVTEQLNQVREWLKSEATTPNAKLMDELAENYQDCFGFRDLV